MYHKVTPSSFIVVQGKFVHDIMVEGKKYHLMDLYLIQLRENYINYKLMMRRKDKDFIFGSFKMLVIIYFSKQLPSENERI